MRELVIMKEEEDAETEEEDGDNDDDYDDGDDVGDDEDGDDLGDDDEDGVDDRVALGRLAALEMPEGGYGEDDDCLNAEDEEYLQAVAELDKTERVRRQLYMAGEPVDDEEDEDGFEYSSPLDKIDMFQQFAAVLQNAANREPNVMQHLQNNMTKEDKKLLQDLMKIANERSSSSNA